MSKNLFSLFTFFLLVFSITYSTEFSLEQEKLSQLKNSISQAFSLIAENSSNGIPYSKINQEKFTTAATSHFLLLTLMLKENNLLKDYDNSKIKDLKNFLLSWQWVSSDANYGIKDMQKDESGITNYVLESIQGVTGASAECKNITAKFNMWHFSLGPNNIDLKTDLKTTAVSSFALFKYYRLFNDAEAFNAAKNAGNALKDLILVPDNENDIGIKASLLKSSNNGEIPIGLLPCDFRVLNNNDTPSCGDGAYVKYYSIYKDQIASTAGIFYGLADANTENSSKFKKAYDYLLKGIFSIKECDGLIANYARFQGPNAAENTCYADNIITLTSKELLYDTALILYYLQLSNPYIYLEDSNFADSLQWIMQLENSESALRRNSNSPYRFNSSTVSLSRRPFVRVLFSALFLRAACFEKDAAIKADFESTAKKELDYVFEELPISFTEKPSMLFSDETEINSLGIYALAEIYEIFTKGCSKAPDRDNDGYYDDPKLNLRDCNDFDANVHPNATELCNGIDDDCDSLIDEGFDKDNDGYTICQNDCNDSDANIHPNAAEKFNGIDDDCDGLIDEKNIVISTIDNNNSGLASAEIYLFDFNCAKQNDFNFIDVNKKCKAIKCKTSKIGICSIIVPIANYSIFWSENNTFIRKDFNISEKSSKIELRKKLVKLKLSQLYVEEKQNPMEWFTSMSLAERKNFIMLLSLLLLLLFIISILLSFFIFLIKKTGFKFEISEIPKIFKKEKSDKELKEVHRRFAFKK